MADGSSRSSDAQTAASNGETSTLRVAIYWLIVGLPFLYGLSGTINKSLALFQ